MTCIVGVVDNKNVYIGADSCGSGGGKQETTLNSKVFKVGEAIIGCTSSYRMIDILTYALEIPKITNNIDRYIRTDFISSVKNTFRDNGFGTMSENTDHKGGVFLVGIRGRLFTVQEDFSVLSSEKYGMSVGCGVTAARGSLHTTYNLVKDPKNRIIMALSAAESIHTGVRKPFIVIGSDK